MKKKSQIISLKEWAERNNISDRHARRLAKNGSIPTEPLAIFITGISEDYDISQLQDA